MSLIFLLLIRKIINVFVYLKEDIISIDISVLTKNMGNAL